MGEIVYVLHGHWETQDDRGVIIACVSIKEEKVKEELKIIAETKARGYCKLCEDELKIENSDTMFEMRDMKYGGFVGFYITEETVQ